MSDVRISKMPDSGVNLDLSHLLDDVDSMRFSDDAVYVKERTCSMEPTFTIPAILCGVQEYLCSRCGGFTYDQVLDGGDGPRYCSQCGARVM